MSTSTCTSYDASMIINSDWAVLRITSGGAKITVSNNPPSTTITDNFSTIRWRNKRFNTVDIRFKIILDLDQTQITVVTSHGNDGYSKGDAMGRVRFYIGDTEYENSIIDGTGTNTKEHTISLTGVAGSPLHQLERHHPGLWFKDGSIVIRAQETLFKVHQSLLALHSSIFTSMFGIPQPCEQELIEGCSVVDLPDNADDVTCILKAIYEPTYFAYYKRTEVSEPISFEDLASILRLSTKYDIPSFRSKCIDELKSTFPCTLEEFDAIGYDSELYHRTAPRPSRGRRILSSALLLFRECDLPAFLPSLFYLLTRGSLAETLSRLSDLPKSENFGCILLGREKLVDAQLSDASTYLNFKASSGCSRPGDCRESWLRRREALMNTGRHMNQCALANVAHWFNNDASFLCPSCTSSYKDAYKFSRKKVWNELPGYFGLGTWEEIRESIK